MTSAGAERGEAARASDGEPGFPPRGLRAVPWDGVRRGEAPRLKPEVHREAGGPAAEIDLVAEQPEFLRRIAFGPLPADFSTQRIKSPTGHADAGEHDGPDGRSARGEARAENRAVTEVDELARLAVAPVEDAEPAPI